MTCSRHLRHTSPDLWSHSREGRPLCLEHLLGARQALCPSPLQTSCHVILVLTTLWHLDLHFHLRRWEKSALPRAPGCFFTSLVAFGYGRGLTWPARALRREVFELMAAHFPEHFHSSPSQPNYWKGLYFYLLTFLFSKLCSRQIFVVIAQ